MPPPLAPRLNGEDDAARPGKGDDEAVPDPKPNGAVPAPEEPGPPTVELGAPPN